MTKNRRSRRKKRRKSRRRRKGKVKNEDASETYNK